MYLQNCYPKPYHLYEDDTHGYMFGSVQTMRLSAPLSELIGQRMRSLWNRFTCTAGTLELTAQYIFRRDSNMITATLGDCPPTSLSLDGMQYTINADSGGVTLCAVDEKALMEGFCTLVQMIVPKKLSVGEESFFIAKTEPRREVTSFSAGFCLEI